jgi:hypothetical protein
LTTQAVVCAGQSAGAAHPTHAPLPSQTLPPEVAQAVLAGTLETLQQPCAQVVATQSLTGIGQSVAAMQAIPASHA